MYPFLLGEIDDLRFARAARRRVLPRCSVQK
jgi:hypothetical protein